MRLDGKVALISGGARGMGAEEARIFAREGAKVVIADLDDGTNVVNTITQQGGDAIDVPTDVADEASCENMVAKCIAAHGRLDILVNNAAMFTAIERKKFTDISFEEWELVTGVNIKGSWLPCKAAIPAMKANGYGKIINVSSGRFFKGSTFFLHYDASKGAVVSMTRSLAREEGDHGIRVNCIAPGSTMSENVLARTNWMGGAPAGTVATRALKRNEMPEDLVGACIYLASADSDFMTGQTIVVDGGSAVH